jgi:hypothetical protein
MLIGVSAALIGEEMTEKIFHWPHLLLATGLSYASADIQQAKARVAYHCAEFSASGPCANLNFPPTVPEATVGSTLIDMAKSIPALLIGLAVGGIIKLLWDSLRQKPKPPAPKAETL